MSFAKAANDTAGGRIRLRIRVRGTVQGVGFRPFVYNVAVAHGLTGFVGNDSKGVLIEAQGNASAVAALIDALRCRAPALAVVEQVSVHHVPAQEREDTFRIAVSTTSASRDTLVSPDVATCDECLAETLNPRARRYRYPFTNCTNCGPRFTIIADVPYDRRNTTMAEFAMCGDCAREYADAADRRFHAQPVCCPACGPAVRLLDGGERELPGDAIDRAAALLLGGQVLAVKGLGGYHLAAVADNEPAVATLRARKRREDKPFALLAADLDAVRELCDVDSDAARLLSSPRRPIVLLPRRPDARVAASVAPGSRFLGVMLPYTPLHHLLARAVGRTLVMTSGNASDEPIAYRDPDVLRELAGIAEGFLLHDRRIHVRTDDSVVRPFRGRELPVRRSRGYAPAPLSVPWPFRRPVLACGGELKNTFCLAKGHRVFLSHHIGDMENYETLRSYVEGIDHLSRLFNVRPKVVAHDLHPEYLSTKYALGLADVTPVGVQHHHAHIAACLADNGESGPVIGVAFDGLGFGPDGTFWGGELLVADLAGFARAGRLEQVRMPGGTATIRQPWRMAAAHLDVAYGPAHPPLEVADRNATHWAAVLALTRTGVNSPWTSSAGRLFDAVASLLGVRDSVTYEGQAAIELEQLVDRDEPDGYPAAVTPGTPLVIHSSDLIRGVVEDLLAGEPAPRIAARFHNGLVQAVIHAVAMLRDQSGLGTVALSGGVFQNVVLLERTVARLESSGLRVLVHHRVPPNDGGICVGQAAVAAARDRSAG